MAEPTERTVKRLFALSGNICAFPGCQLSIVEVTGTVTGEICHIRARNARGPRFDTAQSDEERYGFDNLILLCRHHHKVVDAKPEIYTTETLFKMKAIHENVAGRPEQERDRIFAKILLSNLRRVAVTNKSGNVAINSPGAIQAQTINVRTTNKKIKVAAPPGTIGSASKPAGTCCI